MPEKQIQKPAQQPDAAENKKPETSKPSAERESGGVVSVNLSKPCDVGGEKRTALTLCFGDLTGQHLVAAEDERDAFGGSSSNMLYGLCIAAKAAKCPVDDLLALPAKDANLIAAEAIDFLTA